ncbi:hypothetical protein Hanom_Chr02g00106861 [Helianthus anomalus]
MRRSQRHDGRIRGGYNGGCGGGFMTGGGVTVNTGKNSERSWRLFGSSSSFG